MASAMVGSNQQASDPRTTAGLAAKHVHSTNRNNHTCMRDETPESFAIPGKFSTVCCVDQPCVDGTGSARLGRDENSGEAERDRVAPRKMLRG
jgi:hypothetical protein